MDPTRYRRRYRRSHAHRPLGAAHATVQPSLEAARTSPKTIPAPRYTHQSARITKPSSAHSRNDRKCQNRILPCYEETGTRYSGDI